MATVTAELVAKLADALEAAAASISETACTCTAERRMAREGHSRDCTGGNEAEWYMRLVRTARKALSD